MQKEITNIEDQLLVMNAQDGNKKAMEAIVVRWQKRLWKYAYSMTSDRQASWDITQQTWLGVIKGIGKLNDPAKFKPWIYRITTNKAVNWIKKNRTIKEIPVDSINKCHESKDNTGIREILRKIDIKKQTVINLFYFEQLNISEISTVLRIPQGTVKSRLNSARKELKLILEKEDI